MAKFAMILVDMEDGELLGGSNDSEAVSRLLDKWAAEGYDEDRLLIIHTTNGHFHYGRSEAAEIREADLPAEEEEDPEPDDFDDDTDED